MIRINLERPYITCHMLTSLDGKIVGDFLEENFNGIFYQKNTREFMIVTNAKHGFAAGLPWRNTSLLEKK